MSYQINFAPNLSLGDKDITLSGIRDDLGSFKGYEFNPEKDPNKSVELGTLGTLAGELCKLAELDSDSLSAKSITGLLPQDLNDIIKGLQSSLEKARIQLLHFKIDTSSNEKEVTITGKVDGFTIYSFSAKGFSLEITSGPDGQIKSTDSEHKTITVTLNKRGHKALADSTIGSNYSMKGSKSSNILELKLKAITDDSATFDLTTGNNTFKEKDFVELTKVTTQATPQQ